MPTTAQETSTSEQLKSLIRLQHLDTRIDQLRKLRGDLPEEIRDLEDEHAGTETRIGRLKEEAAERDEALQQADRSIKEAEQLIKKYEDQQTQVRNNREYDALTKEIEAQKQRIDEAQQEMNRVETTAEAHATEIEVAEARLNELSELLEEKKKDLENVLAETTVEQEKIEDLRTEAQGAVDERYLRAYTRLRDRLRDGRAVVPLERGAAAGFAVPPQRQVEIRQRNRVVVCEHTGRIIVDNDQFEDLQKSVKL